MDIHIKDPAEPRFLAALIEAHMRATIYLSIIDM